MQSMWDVADIAISELNSLGYLGACFVGGVACALHGNTRTPKDLDILIINTSDSQEMIKQKIAARNRSFYLIPSKKIGQTYKVLWYDNYQYSSITPTRASSTSIKIDILLPGIMDIPSFDTRYIVYIKSPIRSTLLPVAPQSVVLLLKLQAWSQHRAALDSYYSKEQYKDQQDLERIVPIAARNGMKPKSDPFLSNAIVCKLAEGRIKEYLGVYPDSGTRAGWSTLGFTVPAKIATRPTSAVTATFRRSTRPPILTHKSPPKATDRNTNVKKYRVKPLPKVKSLYSENKPKRNRSSTFDYNKFTVKPINFQPRIPQINIQERKRLNKGGSQVGITSLTAVPLIPKKKSTNQASSVEKPLYIRSGGGWWH